MRRFSVTRRSAESTDLRKLSNSDLRPPNERILQTRTAPQRAPPFEGQDRMDDTDRLIEKALSMGAQPFEERRFWRLVERQSRVRLPEDYKYFLEHVDAFVYGSLQLLSEEASIITDRLSWFNDCIHFERNKTVRAEFKYSTFFPPYPEDGSAYCFARDLNYAGLGWEVQGGVARPRIHAVPDGDEPPEAYDMTFTELMLRVLDGDMPFDGWKSPDDVTPQIEPIGSQYLNYPR